MMADIFRTAPLFASDLPVMPEGRNSCRYHYADMANMPMWERKPIQAWDDTAWNNENRFRGGPAADAVKMARYGWPEGADKARLLHAGIVANLPERRRLARFDVAGAVPSIPRALAGNPMSMRRIEYRETAQRPIVTLVCNVCVSASFPASGLLDHAAAVAAVVDLLEESGFRCDVIVVSRFTDKAINAEIATRLKAPEQPLNLSVMAYGLGHPSFLRRILFGVLQADTAAKGLGSGLGFPQDCKPVPEAGTYTIGAAHDAGSGASPTARFRYILRQLATQDCPGIPEDMSEAA